MEITNIGFKSVEEMDIPEKVYKYRDWSDDYNKRMLTHYELWLAPPSSFEDEHDCKVPIRYDLLTDDIFQMYFKFSRKINSGFSDQEHEDYVRHWQSKGLMRDEERLKEHDDKFFEKLDAFFGVFSVTAYPAEIRMWIKYAAKQKGFCVGFNSIKLFNNPDAIGAGREVDYYDEFPIIRENDPLNLQSICQVYTKHREWEFEKEYRLTKIDVQNRAPQVPADNFVEVIFGPLMEEQSKQEILEVISETMPHVEVLQAVNNDGAIEIEPYS